MPKKSWQLIAHTTGGLGFSETFIVKAPDGYAAIGLLKSFRGDLAHARIELKGEARLGTRGWGETESDVTIVVDLDRQIKE